MIKRIFLIVGVLAFAAWGCVAMAKHADLAGTWYSGLPGKLKAEINGYLQNVRTEKIRGDLIGVIAPHAGVRASGPVAAYAFKAVKEKNPDKIIVVGFSHRTHLPGRIAVFTDDAFVTPLGEARIDMDLSRKLIAYDKNIQSIPRVFESENSVELEIPFIQVVSKDARLVLVAICDQSLRNCRLLADALYNVLRDEKNFVIVASSDMCHYLPYEAAKKRDRQTIEAIKKFDPDFLYSKSLKAKHELMCGYGAVYAVMGACKKLGADEVEILKYANSGDTLGDRSRVVGYLSAAFMKTEKPGARAAGESEKEEQEMFDQAQRDKLLKIARDTIRHYLKTGERLDVKVEDTALKQDMGAFVTLHKHGRLRGCIGNMAATGPLCLTVRDMAIAAATEDPRFPRLTLDELDDVDIEISALTPMRKIDDYNEIETGKHGVMVRMGGRSGVYLPQVADETGWNREQFMNSLCANKAGIPEDAWKTGACEIHVFTAEVFGEKARGEERGTKDEGRRMKDEERGTKDEG